MFDTWPLTYQPDQPDEDDLYKRLVKQYMDTESDEEAERLLCEIKAWDKELFINVA